MITKGQRLEIMSPLNRLPILEDNIDNFFKGWSELHSDLKTLYHYTTLEGLRGILGNRSVWFTNILSLNDPQEISYGINIIGEQITKTKSKTNEEWLLKFFDELKDLFENYHTNRFATYISCFCEDEDLLSQWRAYSQKDCGFNIGFRFDENTNFRHDVIQNDESMLELRKVIYKKEEQIKIVTDYLTLIMNSMLELNKMESNRLPVTWRSQALISCVNILFDFAWSFKHKAFSEEKEWRLVKFREYDYKSEEINFRKDDTGVIPYLNTYIFSEIDAKKHFPIRSVKIGPTLEQKKVTSSIKSFIFNQAVLKDAIIILPKITPSFCDYNIR